MGPTKHFATAQSSHRASRGRGCASLLALGVAIALAAPAHAQTAPAPQAGAPLPQPEAGVADNAAGADIVVTAQRRAEKLSRVPISVVAFNAEQLQNRVINSEQDLGALVPGLLVKNGQTSNQLSYSMRGQTLDPFSGTSPAVLTYLNDAPYNPFNTSSSFFDLGQIQVLKGPQGTLFGRNATGGAVLYTTQMPGNDYAGNLIVRGGERDLFQVQGAIDIPLVKDVLLVRVAGDYERQNGYIHNIESGNTLGDINNASGRITVLFKPTANLKNTTIVQYDNYSGTEGSGNIWDYYTTPNASGQQYINNGISSVLNTTGKTLTSTLDTVYNTYSGVLFNKQGYNLGDSNLTAGPAIGPGRFPGGVAGYTAFSRAHPYDIALQFDLPHHAHTTFVENTTQFDSSQALTLKNIFSYMNTYSTLSGNLDGGPFGGLWLYNDPNNATGLSGNGGPGGQTFKSDTYSDELQAQGRLLDNRLSYTAGGFFSSFKHFDIIPVFVGSEINPALGAAGAFGLPADIDYTYNSRDISKAIYAQVDYKITDRLTATLGGRYTWESVSLSQATGSLYLITGASTPGETQHKNESAPSWTFNLQYQVDPQNMVYFAQRGSFRAGNFNGTVNPVNNDNSFTNEYAHDFELGYKFSGRVGEAPFRFNLAAYEEFVKHAQHAVYAVIQGNPAGFTLNVPDARTRGFEVDSSLGIADWLSLTATGAFTDAKYTMGAVDVSALTGTPGYIIDFDSYPDTPKWSGTIGVDATLPVRHDVGTVVLHGDVYGQTSSYFSSNDGSVTPGTKLPGYAVVNMRLSWNDIMQSKFSAAVYVKNVANRLYYVSGYALGASAGVNTAYPGEPRMVAGEVSVKF
ncbi:MAG: TonB-dependent receptor [Sphingomonadales bacterium]|nr:TonB-dependent receptor [Sphingomonadales bacterium]